MPQGGRVEEFWRKANALIWMVDTTGIEPVTPTMSTSRPKVAFLEFSAENAQKSTRCSRFVPVISLFLFPWERYERPGQRRYAENRGDDDRTLF